MSPIFVRLSLLLSILLSTATAIYSLYSASQGESAAWATLAAALAVIAAVVSAWGSQRVMELEEEKLKPCVYPHFDFMSRYGLTQLRLVNDGGTSAYNIKLEWEDSLKNSKGVELTFGEQTLSGKVAVLRSGQSITKIVDGHNQFFGIARNHVYRGVATFEDGARKQYRMPFVIDAASYKGTPYYQDEGGKTQRDLQQIPTRLKELTSELHKIHQLLERNRRIDDDSENEDN